MATAAEIKIGVLLGYTGPIESLTPDMAAAAELAFDEVSKSGLLLGGSKIISVRADSTCVDSGAATAAGERAAEGQLPHLGQQRGEEQL